ncbi:MAG TPA: class I SAM-dependent methyltransferase [Allosphingosinicella sp.]|jgi:SAM-dependent methyltransferase|nr:class I SAM-dependent methyltransferase [Allosphingosinicella sp.]
MRLRWLARQFARPRGPLARPLIAPWLNRISAPMNALTLEALALRGDEDVLEVGFGGGGLLSLILAHTCGDVFGIDLSPAMVAAARRRFAAERHRLRLNCAPVDGMPIGEAAVDKACSVNSIYFWPDPAGAMSEFARVIRPGGTLSICFEPPDELRKWAGHRHGFRLVEEEEVRALMEQARFAPIARVEGRGRRPDFFLCLTGERAEAEAAP